MSAPALRGAAAIGLALALLAPTGLLASAHAAETHHVTMKSIDFTPKRISARVGDTVEWDNADMVAHTATAKAGGWEVDVPAKHSGRTVMKEPGAVSYFCRYHPNMRAEITVTP